MRHIAARCLALAVVTGAPFSSAIAGETSDPVSTIQRLVVLDVESVGVDAEMTRTISELFVQSLARALPRTTTLGKNSINEMLGFERMRDLSGCDDASCLTEITHALGADHIATGALGKIGDVFLLSFKILDVRRGVIVAQLSQDVPGEPTLLLEATRQLATRLVDPSSPIGVGFVSISGHGTVFLGDQKIGDSPISRYPVTPGTHELRWRVGQDDYHASVRVGPYEVVSVDRPASLPPGFWSRKVSDLGPGTVILGVASLAVLGAGVYFGIDARDRHANAHDPSFVGAQLEFERGKTSQLLGNLAYGVGGAALFTTLMVWLLRDSPEPLSDPSLSSTSGTPDGGATR